MNRYYPPSPKEDPPACYACGGPVIEYTRLGDNWPRLTCADWTCEVSDLPEPENFEEER